MSKAVKLEEAIELVAKHREALLYHEAELDKIKNSEEWLRAKNYLRTMAYQGKIDDVPCKQNGYKIPTIIGE